MKFRFISNVGLVNIYRGVSHIEFCLQAKYIEIINFVDINFAVHKREVVEPILAKASTQVWTDPDDTEEQALLGLKSA